MTSAQALYELTHPVFAEAQSRPVRFTKVEVINPTLDKKLKGLTLGIPGSLILFMARKGSNTLDELRAAYREGGTRLVELSERVVEQYKGRVEVSVEEAVQATIRQPVFADLLYGGATLAHGLFMPDDLDVALLALAYNGGRLASGGLKLAERYREDSNAALEAFIVRTDPPLTAAERAALAKVPSDQFINNVLAIECDTTWWAVAFATVGVAAAIGTIAVATAVATISPVPINETHLSEEALIELDRRASARRLLEIRREALLGMSRG